MEKPFIDCHTHVGVDPTFYLQGNFPYSLDYRNLVEQASRNGIQRLVVFPFVAYFGWEGSDIHVPPQKNGDDFLVPYAFENRRLLEEIYDLTPDYSDRAIPFAIVDPERKPAEQVEALRKLKERFPIRGIKIQATIIRSRIRKLLEEGSCLVDLAAEWDVPMLIHSSIAADDTWSQCSDILDIAEANSRVRFCLAHSCRFDRPSLERLGTLPNTWFDCSAHCIHCDAAVDDLKVVATPENRLDADYSRPDKVMKALSDMLPDRMMWGSDAPFYSYAAKHDNVMFSLFSSYEREAAALELLSPAEMNAILHDNTLRFLGLPNV